VAERDRAAVDVQPRGSAPVAASHASGTEAKASLTSYRSISSSFRPALRQRHRRRRHRSLEHDHRVVADDRHLPHRGQRLRIAERLQPALAGHHQRGRAVADLAGGGRRDAAASASSLTEAMPSSDASRRMPSSPRAVRRRAAVGIARGDRHDLPREAPLARRRGGAPVAFQRVLVERVLAEPYLTASCSAPANWTELHAG